MLSATRKVLSRPVLAHLGARSYSSCYERYPFLAELGIEKDNNGVFDGEWKKGSGGVVTSYNPTTGEAIANVYEASVEEYNEAVAKMNDCHEQWMTTPAPLRGEIVRQIGEEIRANIDPLGKLVSLEVGKIQAEGVGEIQEYVDVCDFATGLSRMLNGKVFPSERPNHYMLEAWNPLGNVGIISAFNFPAAVFGWNSAISMVCGNANIWKGAPSTPLVGVAITKILERVLKRNDIPGAVCSMVTGGTDIGKAMAADRNIDLLSFTGSTAVGHNVGNVVQNRFGKSLLELGGNNAVIVHSDADIELALRGVLFAAAGTAGQVCRFHDKEENYSNYRDILRDVLVQDVCISIRISLMN